MTASLLPSWERVSRRSLTTVRRASIADRLRHRAGYRSVQGCTPGHIAAGSFVAGTPKASLSVDAGLAKWQPR